jgi:adenylosuccinate synthase
MPAHIDDVASIKPIYHRMPSFKEDITQVLNFNDLPKEALAYIAYIENYLGIEVAYVSVGPKRNQTIKRLNLWEV